MSKKSTLSLDWGLWLAGGLICGVIIIMATVSHFSGSSFQTLTRTISSKVEVANYSEITKILKLSSPESIEEVCMPVKQYPNICMSIDNVTKAFNDEVERLKALNNGGAFHYFQLGDIQ